MGDLAFNSNFDISHEKFGIKSDVITVEKQLENMNLLPSIKTKIQDLLPVLRK